MAGAVAGTLEYLISIDSSKVSSGLNAAEGKVKGFGNKLSSWAVAKGQVLGNLITKAGQTAVQFVGSAIDESKAFDKSMSQVAATLGKSTKEIQNLSKFAREMGSKTAFTATEAAEGLNYMALAGYDAEKSMRMLPTVLNLAAAGTMQLGEASDMVTDAQSALGLSIEQTETMVDQMAKTSSKTNTSVSQLGAAFLTVGGTAKKLKGGTAELSALLGVLANNGIKGSEGGTALRNILTEISKPAGKAAKELKKLGISAYDKQGNLRSMTDILSEFGEKTKDMSDKKRSDLFSKMFNVRDLKSIEALLSMTKEDWDALTGEIEDSEGAADKMAKTQLDNLAGDMTIFGSALSEAKLALVEGLTPALRSLTKGATYWISDMTKNFKEKGFKGLMDTAGKAWKFFEKKWTLARNNPFAKFVGNSMKALRTGFKWNDIKNALTNGWKVVTDAFDKLGKLVFGTKADGTTDWPTAESMVEKVKEIWDKVEETFNGLGSLIFGTKADGTTKWPTADEVFGKAKEIWDAVLKKAEELVPLIFGENSAVSEALTNAIHFIQDFGNWVIENQEAVKVGIEAIGAAFAAWKLADIVSNLSPLKLTLTLLAAIATLVIANWDKVKEKVQEVVTWLTEQKEAVKQWANDNLIQPFQEFIEKVKAVKDELVATFVTWINEQVGAFQKWVNENIIDPINQFIDKVKAAKDEMVAAFVTWIAENVGAFSKWVNDNLVSPVTGFIDKIKEAIDWLKQLLRMNGSSPVPGEGSLTQDQRDQLKADYKYARDKEGSLDSFYDSLKEEMERSGFTDEEFENAKRAISGHEDDAEWVESFLGSLQSAQEQLKEYGEAGEEAGENIENGMNKTAKSASIAAGEVEVFGDQIAGLPDEKVITITAKIGSIGDILGGLFGGLFGSAKGVPTVPYDNYITRLHRGEMVLTKSQARQYREGNTGNFDPTAMAASIVAAVREGMAGASVNSFIDGKPTTDNVNRRTSNKLRARRFVTA